MRIFSSLTLFVCSAILLSTGPHAFGQPAANGGAPKAVAAPDGKADAKPSVKKNSLREKLRSPLLRDQPLTEKLSSPRETLRTFFFALNTYDRFPEMIEDALACLDLDCWKMGREEGTFLALELEKVLSYLEIPLRSVPGELSAEMEPGEASLILFDADGFKIGVRQTAPGVWRFDGNTLKRVPAMRRLVEERSRTKVDLSNLREGFSDPRRTFRQFMFDAAISDFYAAARALDLSRLSSDKRREKGPLLAQQLACVIQRRGYLFPQEVPANPNASAFTWHADEHGHITLERVRQSDGKDAWQFARSTVTNIEKMYEACKELTPKDRWLRYNMIVPLLQNQAGAAALQKRPEHVPAHLGSPRAVLKGFFKTMDTADGRDERLSDALEYLNLKSIAPGERARVGGKLAAKLEAVLRKAQIDLASVSDEWNAPPQTLGESRNFKIEIARNRDGCWRFTEDTLTRVPAMFETLAAKDRADRERTTYMDSPRDTMTTFLTAARNLELDQAARCLDLSDIHASAQAELGPVLAFKLKYVLDRVSRIYVQEIPDDAEGPRYVAYHGKVGRVVIARKLEDPGKGHWLFTSETVDQIEPMFRQVLQGNVEAPGDLDPEQVQAASIWETPGVWLRLRLPAALRRPAGFLDVYQWIGLALALVISALAAYVVLGQLHRLVSWILHKFGSALSAAFVAKMLRPLTWLAAAWLFFHMLVWLDLPTDLANEILPLKKFLMAALFGWFALKTIDLIRGIYTNSELLKPHRNLGDMIVPVSLQLMKTIVLVLVLAYVVYQIGKGDLLTRFLTGLGVAGLAASLAAQDALKSFFGTLMLIGERAFKIGDRIIVDGKEGVVEQVGFRSTRLRTGEDSLLTIPNSTIAANPIDNMGMRQARSYRTTVLLNHQTALSQLLDLRDRLKSWLLDHPLVLRQRMDVRLQRVTELGIEITVSLFYAPKEPGDEGRFQEGVTCEILRLTGELGVVLASRLIANPGAEMQVDKKSRSAA